MGIAGESKNDREAPSHQATVNRGARISSLLLFNLRGVSPTVGDWPTVSVWGLGQHHRQTQLRSGGISRNTLASTTGKNGGES
jgi:hypothetical protein